MKNTSLLLLCLLTTTAWSQSYIRPSKGKALTVLGEQHITITTPPIYSAVYDFSSFEAVELLLEYDIDCYHVFSVYGAYTPNGPFSRTAVLDPNSVNEYGAKPYGIPSRRSRAYTVSNLPPYIKFRLSRTVDDQPWFSPFLCSNFFGATAVPLAFAPRKTVSSDQVLGGASTGTTAPMLVGGTSAAGPIKTLALESRGGLLIGGYVSAVSKITTGINSTTATYITTGAPSPRSNATLQNMGTVPVFCAVAYIFSAPPSTTSYNFVLAGGSAPNDGLGRSVTLGGYGSVQCVTAAGTSSVLLREFR